MTQKKPTISQVVEALRGSAGFNAFVGLVQEELDSARQAYESQVADEFKRGELCGFKRILEILSTGK